jgi:hypothetical protein
MSLWSTIAIESERETAKQRGKTMRGGKKKESGLGERSQLQPRHRISCIKLARGRGSGSGLETLSSLLLPSSGSLTLVFFFFRACVSNVAIVMSFVHHAHPAFRLHPAAVPLGLGIPYMLSSSFRKTKPQRQQQRLPLIFISLLSFPIGRSHIYNEHQRQETVQRRKKRERCKYKDRGRCAL